MEVRTGKKRVRGGGEKAGKDVSLESEGGRGRVPRDRDSPLAIAMKTNYLTLDLRYCLYIAQYTVLNMPRLSGLVEKKTYFGDSFTEVGDSRRGVEIGH